jgi:DNA-binding MarR family transcriptional regulator
MENSILNMELLFAVINGKVSSAINRCMHRDFRNAGLEITPEQWTILMFLWQNDGVTQKTISDATYKDKPSITRLIDNLEKQGLVTRSQNTKDRRSNKIFLTKKGQELYPTVKKITLKTMQEGLNGLTEKDISQAQYLLKKIFENLQ